MANIPQKVADRIAAGIKKFQPILTAAQAHDANESDTVIIITDKADEARKRIARAASKALRSKSEKNPADEDASVSVQKSSTEIYPPSVTANTVLPPTA